jgi:hypothetical protein
MTVFVPGMSGESLPFYDALARDPSRADGLTFGLIAGVAGCGRSLHDRVRALIAIAAPQFREPLAKAWADDAADL